MSESDRELMQQAIDNGKKCEPEDDRVHPKVGAVVVKDGEVLASTYRGEFEAGEHAEFTALERIIGSAKNATGSTVYTTLEPCTARCHPKVPCAHRLAERGVHHVVVGMLDPNPTITGKGLLRLREAGIGIELFTPDLMAQVEDDNREFIRQFRDLSTKTEFLDWAEFRLRGVRWGVRKRGRDFYEIAGPYCTHDHRNGGPLVCSQSGGAQPPIDESIISPGKGAFLECSNCGQKYDLGLGSTAEDKFMNLKPTVLSVMAVLKQR